MATALHSTRTRFFDKCGKPLCGGTVYTYQVGTTTNKITYTDASKTAVNTNPVILDSIGSAAIFLDGAYRVRVLDRNGVLVEDIAYIESWASATEKDALNKSIQDVSGSLSSHVAKTDNPHGVTKAQVGLGNVDNTADIDKPVSNAAKAYIDKQDALKADSATTYSKSEVDTKVSAVSGGYIGAYSTLAELQAKTGMTAGQVAKVMNDSDPTKNGDYYYNGTNWAKGYDTLTECKSYTNSQLIKVVGTKCGTIISATSVIADWSGFSRGFAFPFTLAQAGTANQIVLKVGQNDTTNKTLKVTLRDSTVDGTVIKTITKSSAEAFGTSTALTDVTLDFDELQINANQTIYVVLEMLDANNQQTIINTKTASGRNTKYKNSPSSGWANAIAGEQPYFILNGIIVKTISDSLATVNSNIASIENNLNPTFDKKDLAVYSNAHKKGAIWGANSIFSGWGAGYLPDHDTKASKFSVLLIGLNKIDYLTLNVYSRTENKINDPIDPPNEVKVFTKNYNVSDLVYNAKAFNGSYVDFDISNLGTLYKGTGYVFFITAYRNGQLTAVGAGDSYPVPNGDIQQYQRGWYLDKNSYTSPTYLPIAANGALAYKIVTKELQQKPLSNPLMQSITADFDRYQGFDIVIRNIKINRVFGDANLVNKKVTIATPQSASVSESVLLIYASSEYGYIGTRLKYQYVDNITVKDASGNTLVRGVDYEFKKNSGRLYGLKNIGNQTVTVTYTGHNHRYDLIVFNSATGDLEVVQGTERAIDPENYQPTSNKRELFLVYVTKDGCELLPTYRYDNYMPLDYADQFTAMMRHNKLALTKTFAKLYQKQPIKIIGYGDSITAQGDGWGDSALIAGGNRDRAYILEHIPQDTIASQITLYDGTDKDFLGSPYKDHVKIGWNWILKATLEQVYGVDVTYHNRGIGGTVSGTRDYGGGMYGGLYPARLNAMLDGGGDLLVLAFGMNELGSNQIYDNCRAIIEQFKARTGGDVVVMTTPQINKWGIVTEKLEWQYTHDELVRCALDTNSAFISNWLLESDDFAGNNRLSQQNMCNDNVYNHPTHFQMKHIGNMLSLIFKPA